MNVMPRKCKDIQKTIVAFKAAWLKSSDERTIRDPYPSRQIIFALELLFHGVVHVISQEYLVKETRKIKS